MFPLAIGFFTALAILTSVLTPITPEECGGVYYDDDTQETPPAAMDPNDKNHPNNPNNPGNPKNPRSYNHPKNYVPFRVYFEIEEYVRAENKQKLTKALAYINDKLSKLAKAPRLIEVRKNRKSNPTGPGCQPATCHKERVPNDYWMPCWDAKNDAYVDEKAQNVTVKPNQYTKSILNQNFSLIVFVSVAADRKEPTPSCNGHIAHAATCAADLVTNRPTHGRMTFCKEPKSIADKSLRNVALHEVFHIFMDDFVGSLDEKFQCDPKTGVSKHRWAPYCKDKTWRSFEQSWMDESGKSDVRSRYVSILPGLSEVAKNHFQGCDKIDGIELNTRRNQSTGQAIGPDFSHWNQRLFPDKIMSPVSKPGQHLSVFTLTAMKAYSWFLVDMSQAEPLTLSKPSGLRCELQDQSCFQIIKRARETHISIAPYCDNRVDLNNPMAANRCSKDQQTRLDCFQNRNSTRLEWYTSLVTDQCPVLMTDTIGKPQDDDYDDERCNFATKTGSFLKAERGESVGKSSICVTFTRQPYTQASIKSLCMFHECRPRTQSVVITRKPLYNNVVQACPMECSDANSNKLVNFSTSPECSNGLVDDYFTILCPDYRQLCNSTITTTNNEPTPSETSSKGLFEDGTATTSPAGAVLPILQYNVIIILALLLIASMLNQFANLLY